MAIGTSSARLLCNLKRNVDIDFSSVLMLGRQELIMEDHQIQKMLRDYMDVLQNNDIKDTYCEKLFSSLGAEEINSMDISAYEGATVIQDLNKAIPSELEESYTCIVDGGATEHIYNFPQVIWNIMKMLKVGGYYIGIVPTNNWSGHGFYQFSPSLYLQLFCEDNHFELKKIYFLMREGARHLWEIVNADREITVNVGARPQMCVVAKKTAPTPENIILQQRRFSVLWDNAEGNRKRVHGMKKVLVKIYQSLPFRLQDFVMFYYYLWKNIVVEVKI